MNDPSAHILHRLRDAEWRLNYERGGKHLEFPATTEGLMALLRDAARYIERSCYGRGMQTHQERVTIKLDDDVVARVARDLPPAASSSPSGITFIVTKPDPNEVPFGRTIEIDVERTGATYRFPASRVPCSSAMLVGATINGITCAEVVDEDGMIILANMGPPPGHDPTVAYALEMRRLAT